MDFQMIFTCRSTSIAGYVSDEKREKRPKDN